MEIKTVLLSKVKIGDPKSGTKNKKDWKAWPVGIEVDDEWHNGFFFDKDFVDEVGAHNGEEMTLAFFEEEYEGDMQKKFKKVSTDDLMSIKFVEIEQRLQNLENEIFPGGLSKKDVISESKPKLITEEQTKKIKELIQNSYIKKKEKTTTETWLKEPQKIKQAEKMIKQLEKWIKERKDDDLPF